MDLQDGLTAVEKILPTIKKGILLFTGTLSNVTNFIDSSYAGYDKFKKQIADITGVKEEDVEKFVSSDNKTPSKAEVNQTAVSQQGNRTERRVPMSRMRARIAERLLEVQQNAAILTTFNEVDMSKIISIREAKKDSFQKTSYKRF